MKKVNAQEFENEIKEGIVLVDFFADWCGPCQMLGPELEALEQEDQDFKLLKVNVDEESDLAGRFKVMSIPALFLFKDGKLVDQALGYQPKDVLRDFKNRAK